MENIAFLKAQKRVSQIRTYYWLVIGYIVVVGFNIYRNWSSYLPNKIDEDAKNAIIDANFWIFALWGIFLVCYGITLFHPFFKSWEERKTKVLMKKYLEKN